MLRGADKDEAIKLYKPLVSDANPVVRSKASGQLSRLVPPPPTIAAVTPTPVPDPAPPVDDTLPRVKLAFDEAAAVAAETKTANEAFEALAADLATTTAAPARDDTTTKHVGELATNLGEAAAKLETVAASSRPPRSSPPMPQARARRRTPRSSSMMRRRSRKVLASPRPPHAARRQTPRTRRASTSRTRPATGTTGVRFATSMNGGDAALGRMTSPAFPLDGTRLTLRLGGGTDPATLRVELWVDGAIAKTASVPGPGGDSLRTVTIELGDLRGKQAKLVLIDDSKTAHLNIDDVWLWR